MSVVYTLDSSLRFCLMFREELLAAMSSLEDERHRARTLQNLVTSTHTETRKTPHLYSLLVDGSMEGLYRILV